jgi:hypothetical protein
LRYWRTTAKIVVLGIKDHVWVKINGWDQSRSDTQILISELPAKALPIKRGAILFVWVAEGPGGMLVMKDWEAVPPPIDESELIHTP